MLSKGRCLRYEELKQALERLQQTATQGNLDRVALLGDFTKVQECFGNRIMMSGTEDSEPESLLEQPYLTEIHKVLRMLGMDVTFLQASRSPETVLSRQTAMSDHLVSAIGYCGALLASEE